MASNSPRIFAIAMLIFAHAVDWTSSAVVPDYVKNNAQLAGIFKSRSYVDLDFSLEPEQKIAIHMMFLWNPLLMAFISCTASVLSLISYSNVITIFHPKVGLMRLNY